MPTKTKTIKRSIGEVTKRAADNGTSFSKVTLSNTKRKDNS